MKISIQTGELKAEATIDLPKEWSYEPLTDRARFRHENGMIFELALTTIDWPPSAVREQFTKDYKNITVLDSHVALNNARKGVHAYYLIYKPQGIEKLLSLGEIEAIQAAVKFSS